MARAGQKETVVQSTTALWKILYRNRIGIAHIKGCNFQKAKEGNLGYSPNNTYMYGLPNSEKFFIFVMESPKTKILESSTMRCALVQDHKNTFFKA